MVPCDHAYLSGRSPFAWSLSSSMHMLLNKNSLLFMYGVRLFRTFTPGHILKFAASLPDCGTFNTCTHRFLSPPVLMHGGLIVIALRLCVTGPKIRLEKNSYLKKYYSYEAETSPQYVACHGAYWKNTHYTLTIFFCVNM